MSNSELIRKIYLYVATLIGLVLIVIGCVNLLNLGLRAFIFTKADSIYEYPAPVDCACLDNKVAATSQQSKEEKDAEQKEQTTSRRQREASIALSLIIIGMPLYLYHWRVVQKDKEANS